MSFPKDLLQKLQPEEATLLRIKYQTKPFGKMDSEEIDLWTDALLLKIHTVTGWVIPEGSILNIITDQFRRKLVESYTWCNPDEIEYAFRNYGTTVKDWGKSMNLSLIDEVMTVFLEKRREVSKIEEQVRMKSDVKELPGIKMTEQEIVDTAWDVWNVTGRVDYISESTYEVLAHHSLIVLSNEQKHQLMSAAHSYLSELSAKDPELFERTDRKEVQKRYAKKMAVARLFREYKYRGHRLVLP